MSDILWRYSTFDDLATAAPTAVALVAEAVATGVLATVTPTADVSYPYYCRSSALLEASY